MPHVDSGGSDASAHIADGSAAHAASAVSVNSATLVGTGTDVQAVLEELDDAVAAAGAPTTADYLVATAQGALSAEIVVGATPGGELGGSWASPTVDATHAGGTHAAAGSDHISDASAAHAASAVSVNSATLAGVGTDVQAVLEELDDAVAAAGAPTTADYLVATAQGGLSAEIVVGATPGGELGGSWASPTVDATHAGTTHSAASDTHVADTTTAHAAASVDAVGVGGGGTETVKAVGNTGSTETIALALSDGNVQTFTVNADCTFTMPSSLGAGAKSFTAILTDSGGPRAITFTGVKWSGGANPTVMSGASGVDIFTFLTIDGGTTWYGFIGGQAMAV